MKVFKAKRKFVKEGRDKPYWIDVGFTIIEGDWEGQRTIQLVDERTGIKYPCFENRPKDQQESQSQDSFPADNYGDDVPF